MTHPVILYVASEQRAVVLQRDHDPSVLRVRRVGTYNADRASAVIVEVPFLLKTGQAGQAAMHEFADWLEWVPTRLVPGAGKRITIL